MASTSKVQSDGPPAVQSPQLQQSTDEATDAVVPDAHPGRGETVPEPLNLPDICKPEWQREGMPDTEFYRKYPPDPWGEEASPNARVWKIYRDQQDLSHNGMLDGWNKTLDVLLIFAGLFSAVLTAFLIESYKALQPDYTQYVAAFLYAAAVSHNGTGGIFPALDMIVAPDRFIQTSIAQRWTNGLWFSSLVISLAVALLCMLIKQWLDAYHSHVSSAASSPIHWARRHSLYHRGLKKWGLPGLISFLPLLLHVALFLFFVGLILFLHPLDGRIARVLLGMVSCIAAFYALSLVLPAWHVECPSYTPLLALTRDQDAHETQTITMYGPELDGYVISALIQLPTDSNRDIVHAACVAIPAVGWSRRTIDVISGSRDALLYKLVECEAFIPWTGGGFSITSREQLMRAYEAVAVLWFGSRTNRSLAGGDRGSFLLRALGIEDAEGNQPNIDLLIWQLKCLHFHEDGSNKLPRRSACLAFLEFYSLHAGPHLFNMSYFLLFFCAGRFAGADMPELVRALRSVELVLGAECSIQISAHNGGEEEYILAVANGMWLMLAESPRYSIDTRTAQIVAFETFACFHRFFNDDHVVWAQISGLSAFVRSPTFIHCVDTKDRPGTANRLDSYMIPFRYSGIVDRASVRLENYWACIATLLKFSWDCASPPVDATSFADAYDLFPVEPRHWNCYSRLSEGGPYATQDDWYEPPLTAFLVGPNAVTTWTSPRPRFNAEEHIQTLGDLAHRISIVLCRRQRLGRDNDTFVPAFFSGPFLLARFRDSVSLQHPRFPRESSRKVRFGYEDAVVDLAKHCLKLSPERFMAIVAQLEETGAEGSELRTRAVAFSQRMRDGSTPGGALSAECEPDCPCMLPAARAPRIKRERWDAFAARFRHGHAEPATPPDV